MAVATGTRFGPYEVLGLIGAGGMGEVYKARDTRLDRSVAIKVLPEQLSADPERRARFEREAKTVAALTHPHICTLHDVGQHDGTTFLVMEYLTGETLAERLRKGALPLDQALTVATEIADALAVAHRQGVIHRDLKPGNVMLTKAGTKLLDFGLAKLTGHGEQPAAAHFASAPTRSGTLTGEGTIVGTLPFMAPEQLEGKPADARTDLWALGAILYEMVTGKRAFEGTSAASLMGAILERDPVPLSVRQPLTPPALERLVKRCLAKDPEARWDTAHDVAEELRWVADELRLGRTASGGLSVPATVATAAGGRRRIRRYGSMVLAPVMIAVLAVAAWVWRFGERSTLPPARLIHLTSSPGSEGSPALSPDGRQVAFQSNGEDRQNWDIYVKLVGETAALRLTTDSLADTEPSWSPDGTRIAFKRSALDGRSAVLTMSPLGGAEQKLADLPDLLAGLSWSPDGKWLAVARDRPSVAGKDDSAGIYALPTSGGDPVRVTSPPSPSFDQRPTYSPDGRSLAFVRSMGPDMAGEVLIQSLARDGAPTGGPRQITRNGMFIAGLAWHPDGRSLVYAGQPAFMLCYLYLVSIDGDAPAERIELAGADAYQPSTSPGINRLAFRKRNTDWDVWQLQPRGAASPLIRSSFSDYGPGLSPDGRRVAFTSNRNGESCEIWTAGADGGAPTQLTHGPGRNQGSATWSPDGRWIAFDSQSADGTTDIYVVEPSGGRPRRITSEPSNETAPSWSRDGQWLYFRSDRTGRAEVWRAPSSGGTWEQVTNVGAEAAVESTDGKTLFYVRTTGELFAKPLSGGSERSLTEFARFASIAVVPGGIYYWGRAGTDGLVPLRFLDLSSRTSAELARVPNPGPGLAVSLARRDVLFVQSLDSGSDLMLIENFR